MAVGDVPPAAHIKPSLKQAWTNIWPHFWWLLLFGLLSGLASNFSAGSEVDVLPQVTVFFNIVGGLVGIFVGIPLGIGVVKAHLAVSRGDKPTWSDLGYAFGPRYWPAVGLGVLSFLIVLGGLILLIVPGVYWGVKLSFAQQRFVADGLGPVEAIKASFADVGGRWWNVFGLFWMSALLVLAGLLALGIGVLVALVLIPQMYIVYWRAAALTHLQETGPRGPAASLPASQPS